MLASVKSFLKNVPVIGPGLVQLRRAHFRTSVDYWEKRYRKGGDSGPGSYNRLAEFKANFLNTFVQQHHVASVIEHGSGDGAQLKLARYPAYTGVDVSPKAIEICRTLFANDPTKRFFEASLLPTGTKADLALSLDVIYHLVEDHVFDDYMRKLFASGSRFVVVYSSNITKDWHYKHVHHRAFTDWVAKHQPQWFLQSKIPNEYPYDPSNPDDTSFSDFYVFAATS
jgi:hypothetical protein